MNELLNIILTLTSEEDTRKLACIIADAITKNLLDKNFIVYLQGDLGTGKTTFTRFFLNRLGHTGKVKSPTYTLIEHYNVQNHHIYHLDLYRLADPQEMTFLGLDDYLASNNSIFLIEWPDKADDLLPAPSLKMNFVHASKYRSVELIINTNNSNTQILWKELEKKLSDAF